MVRLILVLRGVVDCSLAVTNNSPVWRPQGTHGESYPCIIITVQCVWWYYSVLPFCKPFHLDKIQASKYKAVFYILYRNSNYLNSETNRYCTIWWTWTYDYGLMNCSLAVTNNSSVYLLILPRSYVLLICLARTVYTLLSTKGFYL